MHDVVISRIVYARSPQKNCTILSNIHLSRKNKTVHYFDKKWRTSFLCQICSNAWRALRRCWCIIDRNREPMWKNLGLEDQGGWGGAKERQSKEILKKLRNIFVVWKKCKTHWKNCLRAQNLVHFQSYWRAIENGCTNLFSCNNTIFLMIFFCKIEFTTVTKVYYFSGPYAGFFCQGGKRAEGPYIFKYEAIFILPYIFKVK